MIVFKKLRWQNLLSTGNQFTELDLNRSSSTLVVGENGAGKSTFIEALTYALYGKPYRNINKPQLLNSITGKGLLVELEFSIGKKEYMIRRGMKPNVFEIYLNGEMLNQNAGARDDQEYLEKNILKLNFKSFSQIVVLGSANYVPFMQLPSMQRRAVVILGISKDIPDVGNVPLEIASIIPRSAFAIPLITSVDCGVGIKAALLPVVSAAITY